MIQHMLTALPAPTINEDERHRRLAACYALLLDLANRRDASSNTRANHSGKLDAPSAAKHQEQMT